MGLFWRSTTPRFVAGESILRNSLILARALACMLTVGALFGASTLARADEVAELLSALVSIRSEVPDTARTAETLGTRRAGSGIVIDGGGLIVTVGYLILEADKVDVVSGDESVPATVLAYDHDSGLGLLRATAPLAVTPMSLGSSQGIEASTPVLIASAGGESAVRPAMVVERREFAGFWEYMLDQAIFTVPPHPGFAGAALMDSQGQLVGVGSLVVSDAFRGENALPGNMFIPVDALQDALGPMLVGLRSGAPKPWLGVYTQAVDAGLLVRRVAAGGPSELAGVAAGDIITDVSGEPVKTLAGFYKILWRDRAPGDDIVLSVMRGVNVTDVRVTAGDRYDWLSIQTQQ